MQILIENRSVFLS